MAYKVLNLLSDGGVGGIENLCKCISDIRTEENCFCCLFEEGAIYEEMKKNGDAVSLVSCGSMCWWHIVAFHRNFIMITVQTLRIKFEHGCKNMY